LPSKYLFVVYLGLVQSGKKDAQSFSNSFEGVLCRNLPYPHTPPLCVHLRFGNMFQCGKLFIISTDSVICKIVLEIVFLEDLYF